MISELGFARDYSSFWRQTTPMMEGFVRQLNRGGLDRNFAPLKTEADPRRFALLNEIAFSIFCYISEGKKINNQHDLIEKINEFGRSIILALSPFGGDTDLGIEFTSAEIGDVSHQVARLLSRLGPQEELSLLTCRPKFNGCGIVNSCEGDIIKQSTLFEIKAGDRPLRSIDLRQILTYLALNYASQTFQISNLGLINPRVGVSVEMPVDGFCFSVSGKDMSSLMDTIIQGMSAGEISR